MIYNTGDLVRDCNILQAGAILKSMQSNSINIFMNIYAGQAGAIIECLLPDSCDTLRNNDAG